MRKTPEQAIGRLLARKDGSLYQDGDFHYDAREIINALSRHGFRIVKRRASSRQRGKKS